MGPIRKINVQVRKSQTCPSLPSRALEGLIETPSNTKMWYLLLNTHNLNISSVIRYHLPVKTRVWDEFQALRSTNSKPLVYKILKYVDIGNKRCL